MLYVIKENRFFSIEDIELNLLYTQTIDYIYWQVNTQAIYNGIVFHDKI